MEKGIKSKRKVAELEQIEYVLLQNRTMIERTLFRLFLCDFDNCSSVYVLIQLGSFRISLCIERMLSKAFNQETFDLIMPNWTHFFRVSRPV